MKLIILRNNLLKGLKVVEKTVGDSSNLPILDGVKIEAEDSGVVLKTTDLESAVMAKVSGKVNKKGSVVVPFFTLDEIVKNLASEKINLELKGNNLIVSADSYEAAISVGNFEDFPIIPTINNKNNSFTVSKNELSDYLTQVLIATQHSDIRPEISGVYFSYQNNHLSLVGTDSFRLVERVFKPNQAKSSSGNIVFILPLNTAYNLVRIMNNEGDVMIFADQNQVLFKTEDVEVVSRVINGSYPDYKSIIPKESKTELKTTKDELINAIKVTKVFAGRANDIVLGLAASKNMLEIKAKGNKGENIYRVPVKINGNKISKEFYFNWRYILDGLKIFPTKEVVLGINETDKPVVIKGIGETGLLYLVMPIRS